MRKISAFEAYGLPAVLVFAALVSCTADQGRPKLPVDDDEGADEGAGGSTVRLTPKRDVVFRDFQPDRAGGSGGTAAASTGIVDTHIHLWNFPRADGGTFPPFNMMAIPWLSKTFTAADYTALSIARRIQGVVLVEACVGVSSSRIQGCNQEMLDWTTKEPKMKAVVGSVSLSAEDFTTQLEALAANKNFVGIRAGGFFDSTSGELRPGFAERLKLLADKGLVVDTMLSSSNKATDIAKLAGMFPTLKIVINHLGDKNKSKEGFNVEDAYKESIDAIAPHKNIYMKVSDIQRLSDAESMAMWPTQYMASTTATKYEPVLNLLYDKLGMDRLIFGSNWPVSNFAGTPEQQVMILEAFLMKKGSTARNRVMRDNAIRVYNITGITPVSGGIVDTHIHLWNFPRTDGGTYPPFEMMAIPWLSKTFTAENYNALPVAKRVEGIVLVEACVGVSSSRIQGCNQEMLDWTMKEPKIKGVVGSVSISADDFATRLEDLAKNSKFVGIRAGGFFDSMTGALRPGFSDRLKLLADKGLVVDTMLSGSNKATDIAKLAEMFPMLKIVINHLGDKNKSKEGFNVEDAYKASIEAIAPHKNVYMKVSDIQRLSDAESMAMWPTQFMASTEPQKYEPVFEFLFQKLGEDRLIFGSNWPVSDFAGTPDQQVAILEAWLNKKSAAVRDKVMRSNAIKVYGLK
jgi:L-fuconolactonase